MNDPRLSEHADRTHRVYWGSHGCCLPYRHAGPCVCDCCLVAVEVVGSAGAPQTVVTIDTLDWWTPTAGEAYGEDVLGPPAPVEIPRWRAPRDTPGIGR